MWAWILRRARYRLAVGLAVVASLPWWLPENTSARIHVLGLLSLAAPWLVLGRDVRRRAEGLRAALRAAPAAGRLVLAELTPALLVVATGLVIALPRAPLAAASLFSWTAMLVCAADALDRRAASAGAAWATLWIASIVLYTAPWWAVTWLSVPALAPWPSTLAVGLHPSGAALAAAGLPTLQDGHFYALTLSGVVETRPLPWFYGTGAFAAAAVAGAALAVRAARSPERRVA